jgi:hypothetical protein
MREAGFSFLHFTSSTETGPYAGGKS